MCEEKKGAENLAEKKKKANGSSPHSMEHIIYAVNN